MPKPLFSQFEATTPGEDGVLSTPDYGRKRFAADPRWNLVERVASSPYFQKSIRLRQFLSFVCEQSLLGNTDSIHEVQIGHFVYGKRPDYNASEENIVRVEARRLRKGLERYFAREGKNEPFEIRMPKGGYVPVFHSRPPESRPDSPQVSPQKGMDVATDTAVPGAAPRRWNLRLLAVWIVLLVLGAAFVEVWAENRSLKNVLRAGEQHSPSAGRILSLVFDSDHETNVVLPDMSFALLQTFAQKRYTLSQYLSRSYMTDLRAPESREVARYEMISMPALGIVTGILRFKPLAGRGVNLKYAKDFRLNELKRPSYSVRQPQVQPLGRTIHRKEEFRL